MLAGSLIEVGVMMYVPYCARHLAVTLALVLLTLPVHATKLQVQMGRSYMDTYATNALFVEGVFDARRIGDSRWSWSPDVSVGWINGRDVPRFRDDRFTTGDTVWLLAAGARLQHGGADNAGRGLFLSFQPAVTHGRTQALSSNYEFVSTLGWQGRLFSLQIRHVSNARLREPNRGETIALIGVGFDL